MYNNTWSVFTAQVASMGGQNAKVSKHSAAVTVEGEEARDDVREEEGG